MKMLIDLVRFILEFLYKSEAIHLKYNTENKLRYFFNSITKLVISHKFFFCR